MLHSWKNGICKDWIYTHKCIYIRMQRVYEVLYVQSCRDCIRTKRDANVDDARAIKKEAKVITPNEV